MVGKLLPINKIHPTTCFFFFFNRVLLEHVLPKAAIIVKQNCEVVTDDVAHKF